MQRSGGGQPGNTPRYQDTTYSSRSQTAIGRSRNQGYSSNSQGYSSNEGYSPTRSTARTAWSGSSSERALAHTTSLRVNDDARRSRSRVTLETIRINTVQRRREADYQAGKSNSQSELFGRRYQDNRDALNRKLGKL